MAIRSKTIERSILKELSFTFLIALISFNFILMMEKLLKLTRLLSSVGASMLDMAKIIALIQPMLFTLSAPLSFLIAVLFTYGRLNMDNELTVLRTSGMSFWSATLPVRSFGAVCFILALAFSFYISPLSSKRLRETVTTVISLRTPFAIQEGAFCTAFPDIVVYVKEKPTQDTLKEIFIYDERDKKRHATLFAKRGRVDARDYNISFSLTDGFMHIVKGEVSTELYFDRYRFNMQVPVKEDKRKRAEFTPFELLGEAGKSEEGSDIMVLEFHRRLSFPLLCLMIGFLGPPLSLISGRTGRLGGLTIGLSLFAGYYSTLIYSERLSIAGSIPLSLGAWAPMAILSILTFLIWRRPESK
ncbi:MAG: LptF/LptG family permease [Nitrospirae bacterium]|nr:LptF/LptG family permease [Nitrospirota bacterium]